MEFRRPINLSFLHLCFLSILGIFIRVSDLSYYFFSPDDLLRIGISSGHTLSDVLNRNFLEVHPPMMYVILHFLLKVGSHPIWLRLLGLIPGIMLIWVMYLLGRDWFNKRVGLIAAWLTTFNLGLVLQSQVLRQYSLALVFLSISWWLFLKYQKSKSLLVLWGYYALSFLSVLTHYAIVLPVLFFMMNHLSGSAKKVRLNGSLAGYILIISVIVIAFLYNGHNEWLYGSSFNVGFTQGWLANGFPHSCIEIIRNSITILCYLSGPTIGFFVVGALGLAYGSMILWRSTNRVFVYSFYGGLLATLMLGVLSLYPYSGTRHILHLFIPYVLIVSVGLETLVHRILNYKSSYRSFIRAGILISSILFNAVLVGVYASNNFFRDHGYVSTAEFPTTLENYQNGMEHLKQILKPGDVILSDKQGGLTLAFAENSFTNDMFTHETAMGSFMSQPVLFRMIWEVRPSWGDYRVLLPQLEQLNNQHPINRVIFFSMGWKRGYFEEILRKNSGSSTILDSYMENRENGGIWITAMSYKNAIYLMNETTRT
ncbi:hypothetical protein HGA91_01475 [candidate division WWE3 bacterium]|nr:hypothetical protein [candidate division WWE3 bacterium]